MLLSQLYGRAKNHCKKLSASEVQSTAGLHAIVDSAYKRDTLSAVSDVYQYYIAVMHLKRGQNKAFRNFDSRFEAQVAKLNTYSSSFQIPGASSTLMLFANGNLNGSQRISVFVAAASTASSSTLSNASTMEGYMKPINYASIASMLRQCDKYNTSNSTHSAPCSSHTSSASTCASSPDASGKRDKEVLSPEFYCHLKRRSISCKCNKKGH